MPKISRRESRETAFTLLFEWSFNDYGPDELMENAKLAGKPEADEFASGLVKKTISNADELDLLIARYSQGRKLQRISKVLLAALRMSFCELTKFSDIPVGATINEAVELVKKFGTDEEAAYLNGILGSFERVRKGEKPPPPMPKELVSEETPTRESLAETKPEAVPKAPAYRESEPELIDDIIIEVE